MPRTFALLPAAGKSRRMGRPKLLLPLGESTVLDHVISAVRNGGVTDILVVTGPDGAELAERAIKAGALVLKLADDTPDMRATCLHGLAELEARFHPSAEDGWLLLPADHPTVHADVVRTLIDTAQTVANKTIIVPTHRGRRGHPTWLRWSHGADIRARPAGEGLNALIRARQAETLELDWPSDEVVRDLDTPEDYEALSRA